MKPFKKVLIPVDFSAPSNHALDAAADLCCRYEASATLMYVWENELFSVRESFQLHDPELLPELRLRFLALLETARARLNAVGVTHVDTALVTGSAPAREIARFARAGGFDLIVMGTHGRTGLTHLCLGSVAAAVTRMAPCAVTTIPLADRPNLADDAVPGVATE